MEFRLRQAEADDIRVVWEVNNSPLVRAQSRSSDAIPYEQHVHWFSKLLSDPRRTLYVVDSESGVIGVIRFDRIDPQAAEVSVALGDVWTGKGLGAPVISQGCQKYLEQETATRILAYIKVANQASQKAFHKAGFRTAGSEGDLIRLELQRL